MAELGDTSYVGFAQRLRTAAERYASPPTGYGLNPGVPASAQIESDKGDAYDAAARFRLPPVVRPAPQHVWYEMRGRDQDCTTLTYRFWRVVGAPDMAGVLYVGPKCGVSPLADVVVLEADITA